MAIVDLLALSHSGKQLQECPLYMGTGIESLRAERYVPMAQ